MLLLSDVQKEIDEEQDEEEKDPNGTCCGDPAISAV